MEEAGRRIHGTTRGVPLDLFGVERPLLRALPAIAPDLGSWHRVVVHRDCHVAHDRCLYSVPFALVGKTLWLRMTDGAVTNMISRTKMTEEQVRAYLDMTETECGLIVLMTSGVAIPVARTAAPAAAS